MPEKSSLKNSPFTLCRRRSCEIFPTVDFFNGFALLEIVLIHMVPSLASV